MRKVFSLLLSLVLLTGLAFAAQADSKTDYFPPGVWGDGPGTRSAAENDDFYEKWYGKQLVAMGEKQLWVQRARDKASLTVRLLFLPTFDPGTMLQISFFEDGGARFTYKMLDGAGGYEPGKLSRKFAGDVENQMAAKIKNFLDRIDALGGKIPTAFYDPTLVCTDGTQTVLEFSGAGLYTVLDRHECDMKNDDPLRKLIHLLDEVSGGKVIASGTFDDRF